MNQPTVDRPELAHRTQRVVALRLGAIAAGLAAVVSLTLLLGLFASPATIPRITFVNPTAYSLDIEVSSGPGSGWVSAGFVAKSSTAEVQEVPDQGDSWIFRFDGQGAHGGELRRTRSELEADGWRVEIPAEVGLRLAEAGAPPTP
jgi:hypothetical protein